MTRDDLEWEALKRWDADEAAIVALKKEAAASIGFKADTEAYVLAALKRFDPLIRACFPALNATVSLIPVAGSIATLVFGYAEGPILSAVELWLAQLVADNQAALAKE